MSIFHSPLEQFTLVPVLPIELEIGGYYYDLSFTNSGLYMMFSLFIFLKVLQMVTESGGLLMPTRWQSVLELYYDFILNMVKEQVGKPGRKYFPYIFTIFTFILFNNIIGLIPYTFTPTSHASITMSVSCAIFLGVTIIGVMKHKIHFLGFFLPPGAPIFLAPFLIVIEMVSYFFRAISLGVRLFANMLSGHCLLQILAGFGWQMIPNLSGFSLFAALTPIIMVVTAVFFLEIGVSFLQAYVFTILTCIYFKDAIELH